MTKKGILQRVGRGEYSLEQGVIYQPEIDSSLKSLYKKMHQKFPYLEFCLWNTKWLNEFMIHQPGRFYQMVETEKDALSPTFYFLKEHAKDIFLSPSEEILSQYAGDKKEVIIVNHLITEAPLQEVDKVSAPTLEKMLVDVFCDEELFGAQQGKEMENIYQNAFDKYIVDTSRLLRYASRRKRKDDIQEFIKQTVSA